MADYLVDTNILSYANNDHSLWQIYKPILESHSLYLAAQTVAELRFGALYDNWGKRRTQRLEVLISKYDVIYPNDAICSAWAEVRVLGFQQGRPIHESDAWIAATALAFSAPLVTHNVKDFDFIPDLNIISERA
ncbi:MAG: PIN domain-containing protein [Deinococcota bacterium]